MELFKYLHTVRMAAFRGILLDGFITMNSIVCAKSSIRSLRGELLIWSCGCFMFQPQMLTTILHLNLVMLIDDNKLISIQQLQVVFTGSIIFNNVMMVKYVDNSIEGYPASLARVASMLIDAVGVKETTLSFHVDLKCQSVLLGFLLEYWETVLFYFIPMLKISIFILVDT